MAEPVVTVYVPGAGRAQIAVDGVYVGDVERRSERYNLRRPTTVTYWLALPRQGPRDHVRHRTRGEAIAALTDRSE